MGKLGLRHCLFSVGSTVECSVSSTIIPSRSRMNSKTRRKSGSAVSIGGDAPDSGISSQEDLTASLHSSSTGSSPTHTSGMALCMPQLLTRYQCRLAEVAAQLTVAREANAAAAAAMNNSTLQPAGLSIGPCASVVGASTR
ncbi:hypothetical protein D915_007909 [Fasciola hepatica]|uniref:Uncharacterized protein n=1 Tax=Fasciola hepatica TaxID=6192 RepID=A0A4E0RUY5_FASHE|nr:hypothetical protein D915_007909 [Fasciola hepatica]